MEIVEEKINEEENVVKKENETKKEAKKRFYYIWF